MRNRTVPLYVGSRQLLVHDSDLDISYPVWIHYPANTPSSPVKHGPYTLDVSPDTEIAEGAYPLVLISHGNGGSPLLYRTISTYLAARGYIVAMLEHYGNNRLNNELANSVENLQYRPKHIALTIDHLIADSHLGPCIVAEQIAIIGHSFGGYAALALAGGTPWTQTGQKVDVWHDARIKALVLMAPAAGYYIPPGALSKVDLPILLLTAEHDAFTPDKWSADVVLAGVADKSKVRWTRIDMAGHFSFISPFPQSMQRTDFMPSTDPPGFDRAAFHKKLPSDILDFLSACFLHKF